MKCKAHSKIIPIKTTSKKNEIRENIIINFLFIFSGKTITTKPTHTKIFLLFLEKYWRPRKFLNNNNNNDEYIEHKNYYTNLENTFNSKKKSSFFIIFMFMIVSNYY